MIIIHIINMNKILRNSVENFFYRIFSKTFCQIIGTYIYLGEKFTTKLILYAQKCAHSSSRSSYFEFIAPVRIDTRKVAHISSAGASATAPEQKLYQ